MLHYVFKRTPAIKQSFIVIKKWQNWLENVGPYINVEISKKNAYISKSSMFRTNISERLKTTFLLYVKISSCVV